MKVKKDKKDVEFQTVQFMSGLAKVLRPREPKTISEWADENMVLPIGSNEAGHFRCLPHQKVIMEAITDPYVRDVSMMFSAQTGKTTILLCGIGYYVDYEPSTQMIVLPTLTLSEKFSKTRLATMIRDIPALSDRIAPPKSRESDNTILFKEYPGGHMVLSGANSAASLSSLPLRVIWMDEIDRFPESAGSEGNPIKLAEKRSTTFWNRKHIKTSTPTIAGKSNIEKEYKKGTMEEWCVQCPCCGTWQPYDFHRVVFKNVTMACVDCGEELSEADWKECNHRWIAAHPERKTHRSFHMNELASPWSEWQGIIDNFLDAKRKLDKFHDPNDLISFINTTLGECWEETEMGNQGVTDDEVAGRAEYYEAEIPDGVLMLTAAVDVQKDRFEVEIRGWAREYESWGLYKTEIYGNMETKEPWAELEEYVMRTFTFKNGTKLNVAAIAIDTGYNTNKVYKWVKDMNRKHRTVYGVKGYAQIGGIPLIYSRRKVDIKEKLKNNKEVVVDSTILHVIGVDSGKEDLMNRLSIKEPGEGYCHFPSNADRGYNSQYYKGLTGERKVEKMVRGRLKTAWVKKSGISRNEPLDLYVYGYAACVLRRPSWDKLEEKIERGINYMEKRRSGGRRNVRRSQDGVEV